MISTPPSPASDAQMAERPIVSPNITAARYSAMTGAMKLSPMASASGNCVSDQKKLTAMTDTMMLRHICSLRLSTVGHFCRVPTNNSPMNKVPRQLRHITALYAPSDKAMSFITASINENVPTPAAAIMNGMNGRGCNSAMSKGYVRQDY